MGTRSKICVFERENKRCRAPFSKKYHRASTRKPHPRGCVFCFSSKTGMMESRNNAKIMNVIDLTKKLMSIPSVSGDELAVLAFLERVLPKCGFLSLRGIPLEDETYCLVASKGKSDTWIVGHTDTVPGIVPIEEKDGNLYGRGSCDTKGNIAAALVASKHLSNINFLLTVGEESDFRGARRAAEDAEIMRGKRFLILEPRSSKFTDGQYGAIFLEVSAQGIQKHSALIENPSENAIHQMVEVLATLGMYKLPAWNVGTIRGGLAKNIVAPECFAEAVMRPRTLKEHKKTLKIIENTQAIFPNVSIKLKMALEPLEGKNQGGGFTEAYFFRGKGRKVEIIGAGDLHVAHSPEEYVPIAELEALPGKIVGWVLSK